MTLKEAFVQSGLSYRKAAKGIGLPVSVLYRLVNYGEYPVRGKFEDIKRVIAQFLERHQIPAEEISWPEALRGRAMLAAAVQARIENQTEEIELMQLDRNVLSLFGLRQNPFLNDVEADEDVFTFKGYKEVERAICDAIDERGFLAVVADSGAGKTTIWDGVESFYGQRQDTIVCKTAIKAREKLNPEHLANALIFGILGDDAKLAHDAERRGRQLSRALRAIRTDQVDRKCVLYIDDAHFSSASVLRQLKTFYEEKIGRYRLLSIILVGLPELKNKLALFPEIGNRIRLVEVPPVPVEEYLAFKLRRVGSAVDKLFDPAGWQAFLDRFRQPRRGPLGRPLIVNAQCIRAMVALYQNGAAPGERITRDIIDSLPGGPSVRRVA